MGVFKWLRRERVTVTTSHISSRPSTPEDQQPPTQINIGTIRTEEYKRDLAEFQARRSAGQKELQETPTKKKCGRHSLPVSCTDCTGDPDTTFNYEKKSAIKYKKKKRTRSAHSEETTDGVPNIQFLFQNQVFMPGNLFGPTSFSEPQKSKRHSKQSGRKSSEMDFLVQRQIDFKDDNPHDSPPLFFKNNSLPFDVKNFLDGERADDEVDGSNAAGNVKSSQSSNSPKEARSEEKLWEVMSELKKFDHWADGQLNSPGSTSKHDDSKSETSTLGLPIASNSNLNVSLEKSTWSHGKWGVVPVQIKKLAGVTIEHVKKKRNTEINILRKWRHPNIILLMGLYPDAHNNVHIICERCTDTLYGILHVQQRILSAQTAVHYALDLSNALVFLRMHGYIHTELSSASIMVTAHDTAKLTDLSPCQKLTSKQKMIKDYLTYSPEPQYVNIEDTHDESRVNQGDFEPLLSERSSEAYISANAIAKDYKQYSTSELYHWQAPELFEPNEEGLVYPCSKSDVYSLTLILWECCNASIPWKEYSYDNLKQSYTLWRTGVSLPLDGTYPGCLLALLQQGLELDRDKRLDIAALQSALHSTKNKLDEIEYIIIPARLSKQKSNFTNQGWDQVSPTESEYQVSQNIQHKAVVHNTRDSSTESEKESKSDESPVYETIRKTNTPGSFVVAEKCFLSDEDQNDNKLFIQYEHLMEKECSSACSTPRVKPLPRVKDLTTPGILHRSDSTEYCSILSPDARTSNFGFDDDSTKDQSSIERPTAKLSRSFTPMSYKPLHIKVPEFNLDSIKNLLKDHNKSERSSYNFDIKNYSLPTTPIARSNKLRKNAWLSGDLSVKDQNTEIPKHASPMSTSEGNENPKTNVLETSDTVKDQESDSYSCKDFSASKVDERSPESVDTVCNSFTVPKRAQTPQDLSSPEAESVTREGATSWSLKSSELPQFRSSSFLYTELMPPAKYKIEHDILANVNVKPLVAIHERWIHEANRNSGRSMSLPENNRAIPAPVKPASHCVDTLRKSLPQLYQPPSVAKTSLPRPPSPVNNKNGSHWEQCCQAREAVSNNYGSGRDSARFSTWRKDLDKGTSTENCYKKLKIDKSTDTRSIEEFIRELIRKEFQQRARELDEYDDLSDPSSMGPKNDDLFSRGVANVLESLKNDEAETDRDIRKDPVKSFSRVKINSNNKPLLQITFSRSGENSLQVLDNCVNVTICDSGREKLHQSMEETLTPDDVQSNSLKRCQAFSAIQEARSTEDLYIDDDLSTQMQENFGGKLKLIPLHGSLHELLCERQDDCCLVKVKQENGCDTIYFRCDSSDTESRDALDGGPQRHDKRHDTVVFKRSISLIEERIQRVFQKEKRAPTPSFKRDVKTRPKSEVFVPNITKESRVMSSSTPSLFMNNDRNEEVEVNIENVMCYQDSSSDECLKCQVETDDFELLEREIERDIANSNLTSLACGCLEKISEENLSVINEEAFERI